MNRHSEIESVFQFKLNLIIKNSQRESLFHDQNRGKYSKVEDKQEESGRGRR